MKLAVLSCGAVANKVAEAAALFDAVDELVVADLDGDRARQVADRIGAAGVQLDVSDSAGLDAFLGDVDVVFNGVGPFLRFALPVVDAAIRTRTHYVDICDEYDVTQTLLSDPTWNERAAAAGITVLIGAGHGPGVSNLMAKAACAELDRADEVDIMFGLPFAPDMGVAVNEHMFHSLSGTVTQYLDGQHQQVPAWGGSRERHLAGGLGRRTFGYIGHAEPLTLPRFIPGLTAVTSRFTWWEQAGNDLYQQLAQLGLMSWHDAPGLPMPPLAYLARFLTTPAAASVADIATGEITTGVFRVDAVGDIDGRRTTVTYESHTDLERMQQDDPSGGIFTAVPAAAFLRRVIDAEVTTRGVIAPEACIEPAPLIEEVLPQLGMTMHRTVTRAEHS